jgi:hypothetical protein
VLQPISAKVLAILSSGRASVRNGGHTRMEEDIAFAFLGSNAAPGTVVGPILVSLPSNQQRSQFRRPAVSHSPQWWAHSNGGGHCLCLFGQQCRSWHNCGPNTSVSAQQPAALAIPSASSVSQSTMVGPLEWRRTLHPAVFVSLSVQQFACTMVDLLEWKRTSPLPNT